MSTKPDFLMLKIQYIIQKIKPNLIYIILF